MKHTILISAFSCLPDRGSEPGVGWNWALQAAKTQNVYVLTRTKCAKKIEPKIPEELKENLHFVYCDSSSKLREKSIYLEYIHWQRKAYKFAKKLCCEVKFDYVVHLTFGNLFLPMWIHKLNIPFIWGPLGGGERVSSNFYKDFTFKESLPHIIKDIMVKTVSFNPFVLGPAKKAVSIIARTEDTKNVFPTRFHNKIQIKLETCLDNKEIEELSSLRVEKINNDNKINIAVTGRLISLKNVVVLVEAMREVVLVNNNIVLHIAGDGKQREMLQKKVKDYNIEDNVIFYGHVPREQALRLVKSADIFVYPSLRDQGCWSLAEAMLLEKPIICVDKSGMHEITDEECAIRISCTNNKELTQKFVSSIIYLENNEQLRIKMGLKGKERLINEFRGDQIAKYVTRFLDELDKSINEVYYE